MIEPVAQLRHEESVQFDPDRLEALCVQLGDAEAERVIAHALEEIALKMAALEIAFRAGNATEINNVCKDLTGVAHHIGMTTLARVARDVRHCLQFHDVMALAATVRRLQRICERSVHAIWSLEDISV